MNELAQHIEKLLFDNDCIIVPEFGGFVAFYNHSQKGNEGNTLYPPTRTIGFNPRLKLNDGMLIQSYMSIHDISFSDAARLIEQQVAQMQLQLQETGKVELQNIGEIKLTMHQTYEFTAYNEKLTSPSLYGLDFVEMEELATLLQPEIERTLQPIAQQEGKKNYHIRINRAFVRSMVASVAAIAIFFFLSAPVENTSVIKGSYANLLPTDIFETIESKSVLTTQLKVDNSRSNKVKVETKTNAKPIVVKEVKVAPKVKVEEQPAPIAKVTTSAPTVEVKNTVTTTVKPLDTKAKTIAIPPAAEVKKANTTGKYHLIVASVVGQQKADKVVSKIKASGFANTRIIQNGEKMRISVMTLGTRQEAEKELATLRSNPAHSDAWLLIQ